VCPLVGKGGGGNQKADPRGEPTSVYLPKGGTSGHLVVKGMGTRGGRNLVSPGREGGTGGGIDQQSIKSRKNKKELLQPESVNGGFRRPVHPKGGTREVQETAGDEHFYSTFWKT